MRIIALTLALGLFTFPLCQAEKDDPTGSLSMSAGGLSVTPNEILVTVDTVIARREYKLAEQMLTDLLSKPGVIRPVQAQALLKLGRLALQTERPAEAIVHFRRYVQNYADQVDAPYVNFLLGQTYKDMGAYERARDNFYKTLSFAVSKASSLTTQDFSASVRLTQAAAWELSESEYLSNNWSKAEDLYQRFKSQNPQLETLAATANYRLADCAYQLGKKPEAIVRYESALANAPFHPFAAEAWLRLMSLYGQVNEPQRQTDAALCFIWLVDTLQEPDKLYWQRRCADMLLAEYRNQPDRQIPILETILSFDKSESWMKMLDFYLSLVNRQVVDPSANSTPMPSDKARDDWQNWLQGFTERMQKLRKDFEKVQAQDPPPDSANAHTVEVRNSK